MKYFVHIYHTVRSKFAVEGDTHEEAMKKADELLGMATNRLAFDAIGCVNTERDVVNGAASPVSMHLDTHSAEEVTGYLVDEVDDTEYERTVNYDATGRPNIGETDYSMSPSERDTILAALRLWQHALDGSISFYNKDSDTVAEIQREIAECNGPSLNAEAIDDLCERMNS